MTSHGRLTLTLPEEVKEGCLKLEADINSGRINEVIASYSQHRREKGDYLFVIGEKT